MEKMNQKSKKKDVQVFGATLKIDLFEGNSYIQIYNCCTKICPQFSCELIRKLLSSYQRCHIDSTIGLLGITVILCAHSHQYRHFLFCLKETKKCGQEKQQ